MFRPVPVVVLPLPVEQSDEVGDPACIKQLELAP